MPKKNSMVDCNDSELTHPYFRNTVLCIAMEIAAAFAVMHRAIGGLGIALVRQVVVGL